MSGGRGTGVTTIFVDASMPPPDALTVSSPESGAHTPNSGMRNVKLAVPASSVVRSVVGIGRKGPVTATCVFGGKFSIEQVKVMLPPVEGIVFGLHVRLGAC